MPVTCRSVESSKTQGQMYINSLLSNNTFIISSYINMGNLYPRGPISYMNVCLYFRHTEGNIVWAQCTSLHLFIVDTSIDSYYSSIYHVSFVIKLGVTHFYSVFPVKCNMTTMITD